MHTVVSRWFWQWCCVFTGMLPCIATAESLHIAVAANFAKPAEQLCEDYASQFQAQCQITVASSGTLFAQITHGAPYEIFLSADTARPQALVNDGLASPRWVKPYATGRLAYLNRHNASPSLELLQQSVRTRLAIANPKLAPYGLAAEQTLKSLSVWEPQQPMLVFGNNVLQTFQFYYSGNVDQALVAWSLVKDEPGNALLVPANLHEPIVQQLALLRVAEAHPLAVGFVAYLLSAPVQRRLPDWGYDPVMTRVQD